MKAIIEIDHNGIHCGDVCCAMYDEDSDGNTVCQLDGSILECDTTNKRTEYCIEAAEKYSAMQARIDELEKQNSDLRRALDAKTIESLIIK